MPIPWRRSSRVRRAVRAARGETPSARAQLARQVGMSRGSIANIETGHQHVPLHMILVLARELGVDPDVAASDDARRPPTTSCLQTELEHLH